MYNDVLVCTVMRQGEILSPEMLGGISPYPLFVVTSLPESYNYRQRSINRNWRRLQDTISDDLPKYGKYEYLLLIDSDVIIPPGSVDILRNQAGHGRTPCIDTHDGKGGHTITSCAMIWLYDFIKLDYGTQGCPCHLMPEAFYINEVKGYELKKEAF